MECVSKAERLRSEFKVNQNHSVAPGWMISEAVACPGKKELGGLSAEPDQVGRRIGSGRKTTVSAQCWPVDKFG